MKAGEQWYLNKVIINPNHVVTIVSDGDMNNLMSEGKIGLGFRSGVSFSKVKMDISSGFDEFIVVGSPNEILEKVNKTSSKQLLKG
tara:strand:- start:160 stop:417 length:258 start_codon:yes stop_codon:yes gene_type:complete